MLKIGPQKPRSLPRDAKKDFNRIEAPRTTLRGKRLLSLFDADRVVKEKEKVKGKHSQSVIKF